MSGVQTSTAAVGAPGAMQKFNVFVKSDPPGADIFLGGGNKPIAATPVTLPIELEGAAVKIVLKKSGYEPYEQLISNDTPLSINLRPDDRSAPSEEPPKVRPPAPAPTPKAEPVEKAPAAKRPTSPPKREPSPPPEKVAKHRPPASKPKPIQKGGGELVNPF